MKYLGIAGSSPGSETNTCPKQSERTNWPVKNLTLFPNRKEKDGQS